MKSKKEEPSFIDLSRALYEDSNVKGLDFDLLRQNRERIRKEEMEAKLKSSQSKLNELCKKSGILPGTEQLLKNEKPKNFKSPTAKKVFDILAEKDIPLNTIEQNKLRSKFLKDRMVFEFDTSHDYFAEEPKTKVPAAIFRSSNNFDSKILIQNLPVCPESEEEQNIVQRIKKAFHNVSKNKNKQGRENQLKYGSKKNILNAYQSEGFKKPSDSNYQNIKSDSEEIFEDAGVYEFKPIGDPNFVPKETEKGKNGKENYSEVNETPQKLNLSKGRNKRVKSESKSPVRKRSSGRHRHEKKINSHRRSSRHHHSSRRKHRRSRSRHSNDRKHHSRRHERYSRRHEKSDRSERRYHKEKSEEKIGLSLKTEAEPASKLADRVRKNLAPRGTASLRKRIKEAIRNDSIEEEKQEVDTKIGLRSVLNDTIDPYQVNEYVGYGEYLKGSSNNNDAKGKRSWARGKAKGKKGSKGKFGKQWEQIQKKLKT